MLAGWLGRQAAGSCSSPLVWVDARLLGLGNERVKAAGAESAAQRSDSENSKRCQQRMWQTAAGGHVLPAVYKLGLPRLTKPHSLCPPTHLAKGCAGLAVCFHSCSLRQASLFRFLACLRGRGRAGYNRWVVQEGGMRRVEHRHHMGHCGKRCMTVMLTRRPTYHGRHGRAWQGMAGHGRAWQAWLTLSRRPWPLAPRRRGR